LAIRISEIIEGDIRAHAARDYPFECCGALLGTASGDEKTVETIRPLTNVHEEGHERRYLVSPEEMLALEKEARATRRIVLGFYHSHPDHPAQPSEYDRTHAWPFYSYVIVAVVNGSPTDLTCWTLSDDGARFDAEEALR
jgi:proteasome lid subunit RPN8/RPN11